MFISYISADGELSGARITTMRPAEWDRFHAAELGPVPGQTLEVEEVDVGGKAAELRTYVDGSGEIGTRTLIMFYDDAVSFMSIPSGDDNPFLDPRRLVEAGSEMRPYPE